MKQVKDKDEKKGLLRAFFQTRNIYSYTIFVYKRCQLGHIKIKEYFSDHELFTDFWLQACKPWPYSLKDHTLYFSIKILLHMISRILWNILFYQKYKSINLIKVCSIQDRLKPSWAKFIFKCSSCPRQPHPVWWSLYYECIYRYKVLTKQSLQYHCQKCIQRMVTLIMIDNEQSLLLSKVPCASQEKWGKKTNNFSMLSGTLGVRCTKKNYTFVHVTPRALCRASGYLVF